MFRLSERLSGIAPAPRRHLNRALLFAGGLLVLWLAVQFISPAASSEPHTVYTEESGTVATRVPDEVGRRVPRTFTPGTFFALLLLAGGGALAVFLRRRAPRAGSPTSFIEPVASFALSPNQQLRLVRCGDEVLLLGVTSGQINLLTSYPADAFIAPEAPVSAPQDAPAGRAPVDFAQSHFADVLRNYAARYVNAQSSTPHAR